MLSARQHKSLLVIADSQDAALAYTVAKALKRQGAIPFFCFVGKEATKLRKNMTPSFPYIERTSVAGSQLLDLYPSLAVIDQRMNALAIQTEQFLLTQEYQSVILLGTNLSHAAFAIAGKKQSIFTACVESTGQPFDKPKGKAQLAINHFLQVIESLADLLFTSSPTAFEFLKNRDHPSVLAQPLTWYAWEDTKKSPIYKHVQILKTLQIPQSSYIFVSLEASNKASMGDIISCFRENFQKTHISAVIFWNSTSTDEEKKRYWTELQAMRLRGSGIILAPLDMFPKVFQKVSDSAIAGISADWHSTRIGVYAHHPMIASEDQKNFFPDFEEAGAVRFVDLNNPTQLKAALAWINSRPQINPTRLQEIFTHNGAATPNDMAVQIVTQAEARKLRSEILSVKDQAPLSTVSGRKPSA